MKKFVAWALVFCFFMPIFSMSAFAEPSKDAFAYETLRSRSVSYTCTYDPISSSVRVGGTVNHDTMITYRNATLEVYGILPGESVSDVLAREDAAPLASAPIAVRFSFSIPTQYFAQRFSRYALVLRESDGTVFLADEPQYAGVVPPKSTVSDRGLTFKGIASDRSALASSIGAGTVILPVDLDRLLSKVSHGYLYAVDHSYRYFDKTYVDELDAKIQSFAATGTQIYLQILLSPTSELSILGQGGSGSSYAMPNVYSETVYPVIGSCAEFLADRYAETDGSVVGWIVGSSIDRKERNDWGSMDSKAYVDAYVFYLTALANAGRVKNPALEIVLPFSSLNAYSSATVSIPEGDLDPAELLESILQRLNERCTGSFPVISMIESADFPLGLTNETLDELKNGALTSSQERLTPEYADEYSAYLNTLRSRYANAPERYLYVWTPPAELTGNALACAYAYSYYRLLLNKRVSSFVISFSEESSAALPSLEKILRRIDTGDGIAATENLLSYFGAKNWGEVIDGIGSANPAVRSVYRTVSEGFEDRQFQGSFSYFSFADGNISAWSRGANVLSIHSDYSDLGLRGLRAKIAKETAGDYAEILCKYEYPENFMYTHDLEFSLSVSDTGESKNNLYEVRILLGDETSMLLSETVVRAGEIARIRMDASSWMKSGRMANYIKIAARPLTDQEGDYSLWLFGIDGYSTEHSSEDLETLIETERLRIRNQTLAVEEDGTQKSLRWVVFGVLAGITATGAVLLMLFRREENEGEESPPRSS